MHSPARFPQRTRGVALIALVALVLVGALAFLLATLGPEAIEAFRAKKTEAALAQAREALLGYSLLHRERRQSQVPPKFEVYGFLPMPDLGESINMNGALGLPCSTEGCAKQNNSGTTGTHTYIGRFPWKTLGLEPLQDGYGECLWYAVSASHKDTENAGLMNWDVLGHLDVVIADSQTSLRSTIESAHDRPVAIIFSPGPPLPTQDRSTPSPSPDDVTECGGRYDPAQYLEPNVTAALRDYAGNPTTDSTYFAGASATNTSGANPKLAISASGIIQAEGANLHPHACPTGSTCTLAANDRGLTLTPDDLFAAIRKNNSFRFHINSMLDRMVDCLRDRIAANLSFVPEVITDYSPPDDKSAGRIHSDACFNNSPPGYFNHWREMFFVSQPDPPSGTFTVNGDNSCKGVIVFAGQRNIGQSRADPDQIKVINNYLEGANLDSFQNDGSTNPAYRVFIGDTELASTASGQLIHQDIVRCIPSGTTMETVNSQDLIDDGFGPMASYDPGTRTLTLGSEDAETDKGASGSTLYGCAWTSVANTRGNGFRSYFTMRFMGITGGVGNNGFVFAAIDGENNTTSVCGAAGSHLGYSGSNGVTPSLTIPKIGIEFDQGRDTGAVSTALNSGRNDPCGTSGCGGTVGYNSHSAIVYWGNSALAYDDNVHGAGTNPNNLIATPPGIAFKNYRAAEDANSDGELDSYLYHVRVEVTPLAATAPLSNVRVASATNVGIANPGATIDGVAMAAGNRVLLAGQSSAADNGIYVWTADNASLTRTLDADTGAKLTDATVTVTDGHHAGDWRQTNTITNIASDAQSWQPAVRRYLTQAWIVRDSDTTALIRSAMQDTTTAMTSTATLSDNATLFASAGATCTTSADCTSGQTCGLDNICYRPPLKSVRLGFTNSQRTQDQRVIISDFFTSWLP